MSCLPRGLSGEKNSKKQNYTELLKRKIHQKRDLVLMDGKKLNELNQIDHFHG